MVHADRNKPLIDVMENVFGGVRISTDDEVLGHGAEPDGRVRPWLAGMTVSSVHVDPLEQEEEGDHQDEDGQAYR